MSFTRDDFHSENNCRYGFHQWKKTVTQRNSKEDFYSDKAIIAGNGERVCFRHTCIVQAISNELWN
jgi:hypothetical protein